MAYWDDLARHVEGDDFWMGHPLVRARLNRRITGDAGRWPVSWLRERLGPRAPLARTASFGSGTGALERDLVAQGVVGRITGIELSAACVAEAARRAAAAGFADRIDYVVGDARAWLADARGFDAVFCHGSLHHFDALPELFAAVADALVAGGLLYFDEYVGPAAGEWRLRHQLVWNLLYRACVPRGARRARWVRAPSNPDDPTESVASSAILPALGARFRVLERRDYGGNLVAPIYPYLRREPGAAGLEPALARLLALEDWLLRHPRCPGAASHHCVVLATVRDQGAAPAGARRVW